MADNYIDVTLSEIFGTGVASVEQTETSAEPGGYNVWTITLTNGQTSTFTVRNGTAGGSPMPVLNAVGMTDTSGIYLYLGNEEGYTTGHWYCYANDAWTDYGAYSEKGDPGLAPTVEISKTGGTTTITITDAEGEHVATIEDGISPTVNVANTAAEMTDTSVIYVYTGSETGYTAGNYYFYDTSLTQWVSGGQYQSTVPRIDTSLTVAGAAADSAKVGQEISDLKSQINRGGITEDVKLALMAVVEHIGRWTDSNAQTYIANLRNALYPATNLSYISAVYTQSGTVYDTDSLSSLKANLVVTAHYDDLTTETVTNYSLSGALSEGTSVITVSYMGKTTTFNVTVTADPVPKALYQKVEWVGATVTSNTDRESYIDVGISLTEKIGMNGYDITFSALSEGTNLGQYTVGAPGTLCAWSSNSACWFGSVNLSETERAYGFGKESGQYLSSATVPVGQRQDFHVYWNDTSGVAECGGNSCTRAYVQGSATLALKFGTGMWENNRGSFKFYGDIKVKKDGTIVRDLFPCYRKADGVIGFYDSVNDVFYTKQGSGAPFEKGSDI